MSERGERHCLCGGSLKVTASSEDIAFITDAFNQLHSGAGHGPASAEEAAKARTAQRVPREPTPDPGDGRQWCPGCERWKFLAIHSCPGVPQGTNNLQFVMQIAEQSEEASDV